MDEKFSISPRATKTVVKILGIGIILTIIGIVALSTGVFHKLNGHASVNFEKPQVYLAEHGDHEAVHQTDVNHSESHDSKVSAHGHSEGHGHGHEKVGVFKRVMLDLWHNGVYFTGISIVGIFFLAITYVTWAGWSAGLKRVFESFGYFIPFGGLVLLTVFFLGGHDIFHWLDHDLYIEGGSKFDPILFGKKMYLNQPFYVVRLVGIIGLWYMAFRLLRKESILEDLNGGTKHHDKMIYFSAAFLIIFGVSSSMAAWDWVMSIDSHWFSTMFGWFVFSSWFVAGLSALTITTIQLKNAGYLKVVNENHLHDLGKFMFAFSIFWTYIWFSQFLLIWYSNIPEETIYFVERFFYNSGVYTPVLIVTLVINFLFPFLFFMTRDAKRRMTMLQVGAFGIIIGHWLDFYLMIMPATMGSEGGFDISMLFLELGIALIFVSGFVYSVLFGLSKASLIAKNHPMLEESIHHHI